MAPSPLNICLAIIRWTPVIFITAVVVWSYYAYVIQMCIFTVSNIPEKVIYLVIYHPILFFFSWAYWKTIFTDPGLVPKEFFLSKSDVERFERETNEDHQREMLARHARNLPVQCRTASGAIRYCEKCKCVKPDRAHHCSVCGRCVLKMDHHCPWVNNCVNFTSYKYFVLFLGYALVYCIWVAGTSVKYFIQFWTNVGGASGSKDMGNLHIVFVFFAAIMFSISLLVLFLYHLHLSFHNRSTLESFRAPIFRSGPDKDGFSLGKHGNFIEVFGDERVKWFLPIFTTQGDGITFPTRVAPQSGSYHSMENTEPAVTTPTTPVANGNAPVIAPDGNPSFGDGVTYPIRTVDEDYDSLLGQRQRWMEEGDTDNSGPGLTENQGYDNTGGSSRM